MPRSKFLLALFTVIVLAFLAGPNSLVGAPGGGGAQSFVPGEILLKFKSAASGSQRLALRGELGAVLKGTFRSSAEHWRLGPGVDVQQAVARLRASSAIQYAEPNYVITADTIPNDPRMPDLWGLNNTGQSGGTADADIDADLAWNVSTGSSDILVASIDTGIDYNHPDLAANIWTNPGEIPANGVDDDNNGFVDDVHGYDFINNDGDPFDDNGHGTHTSGTIGAVGNNGVGVVGVNWTIKIMGCKFLSAGGSGSTADAVRAVDYTTMMGVTLSSNSWGGGGFSQTLYDAIANAGAHNIAFIASAGNNGANSDTSPSYPAAYNLANIISVAATDRNDQLASFSNYGAVSVDLAAPGVDTLSTLPGNSYGTLSGTSMACPHVSGVYALIKSVSAPGISVAQIKQVLLNSVDHIPAMAGKCVSNGRLNAFFAIAEPDTTLPGMIDDLYTTDPGSNTMGLTWTATGDDGEIGTASYYEVRRSTAPITEGNWAAATRAGNEPTPGPAGTAEAMEISGLDPSTTYFFAVKAFDEWGNAGPLSNVATGTTLPPPTGQVAPTSVSDELLTGEQSDHTVVLSNTGVGTLDFSIPSPSLGEPMSGNPFLDLGKDDSDPRQGDPVTAGSGGPDTFGYRWSDSDQAGGPVFAWTDISGTGTPLGLTGDDSTSAPQPLGFNMPFYGTLFNSVRVCSNGWLSFTSTVNSYSNQPLPNSGAPENLIAPFWDDLDPGGVNRTYFQSFGDRAIVQWQAISHYSTTGTGTYTFQAIIEANGSITYQYLSVVGTLDSATVGIQNATKTDALQVAFNQAYLHNGLAVRISAIPQWLTAFPISGRLHAGESKAINLHMDASGLEGGTYPGTVNILTNDPAHPTLVVNASLHVVGAPDASVQPTSIAYGDSFISQPSTRNLIVANAGTDTLVITSIGSTSGSLVASPNSFNVPPHGSQNVTVTWTPAALGPFSGTLTVNSNDAGDPAIAVSVTGNGIPTPIMIVDPTSFNETLFSGNTLVKPLLVTNTGGSDLIVDAAADLGGAALVYADDVGANGAGGPDTFGYKWKDSDASGGPAFSFVDISATGTAIAFTATDDGYSTVNVPLGLTFPFYGSNKSQIKVSVNGFITFDTTTTGSNFTNTTLPSASAPRDMIALFWDDLGIGTGTSVRYLNDGTRFIIQWTNARRTGGATTNSYTFQAQLYPSGKILLMYSNMVGTLNSATIGIQNSLRTIGLPVTFQTGTGTPYVHNGLAVQISDVPDWLSVTPSHQVIPPGGDHTFNVTFDSNKRNGGVLNGAIVLHTNIPGPESVKNIPATLNVIGAPIASIIPASFDYGTRFSGFPYLTSFQVVNTGTAVLNVTDVYSDTAELFVEDAAGSGGENIPEAAFPLAPGAARLFNLRWSPTGPGSLNARVHVISDDPVNGDRQMPVTGTSILPPVAAWSPSSFSESLLAGAVGHRTLHLANTGGSDLNYIAQISLNSGAAVAVDQSPELKKDEEDTRPGLMGTGGPDVFGYKWSDSDQPGGPVFNWFDISAIGTPITFATTDDSNSGPFNIGFPFPYYGATFTQARVCTNGWISFTDTATSFSNTVLPSSASGTPANLLAAFWDDLSQGTGNARYYSDGNRFIVQWTNWAQLSPGGELYTFQIQLFRNGRILYQYLSMTTNDLLSATIGIQNATKTDGLTTSFNTAYMHNALAVEFRPPAGWLAVSPDAGTIPANGFLDLDVTFDATELIGGDYSASIDLSTNDPSHGLIQIPAALHVTGIPDVDASPASLTFPSTYVGYTRNLATSIRNVGTDTLQITGVSVSGDFSQTGLTTPVAIPPGGSIPVTVTFAPTAAGTRTGQLTATVVGDPDESSVTVSLQGEGVAPPELHVTPASIEAFLPPASTTTRTLQVCNTGGSPLDWSSGTNIISGAPVAPFPPYSLGKDEIDTHAGILGSGGPDAFGYRWVDSDDPDGPVFDWVDITGIGTPITALDADDEVVFGIPIGFSFPFYGGSFGSMTVSSNGWLSFTHTSTSSILVNTALPNSSGAANMLAGFWDDLSFSSTHGSGRAYYHNDGSRFILSFVNVPHFPSTGTGPYTFQYILYPNGKIVYQYLSVGPTQNSATIGIQNAAENDGLTVVFNNAYVHNNLAVEIKAIPRWAILSPESGVVAAGACQDVTVALDSTDLDHGVHESVIRIQANNDPYLAFADVPVTLTVNNKPIAVAGAVGATECTGNNGAAVMLNGTGSNDPDGDPITYSWSAPGVTFDDPTSATPTGFFPVGTTLATLVVHDGYEPSEGATVAVTVQDTLAPTISSVAAAPPYLWPPNHRMSDVDFVVTATDACDPSLAIILVSAVSSEPDDAPGNGDGQTTGDIEGASAGTPDFTISLRAERNGLTSGRTYTVTYRATDDSGNSTDGSGSVAVPHDLGTVVEPLNLVVSGKQNTVINWGAVNGAEHYDVVRGNLSELHVQGSNVNLGQVVCIEHESIDATTQGHEDTAVPAPGKAFFYAVQFYDGIEESSYGSESVGRATVISPGNGDCP